MALALPWLASLTPRSARGQEWLTKRFLPIYFPLGTAAFFRPTGQGSGDAWQLSPILEPLSALKEQVTVLSNIENYSPFGDSFSVEPANGRQPAAFLTCVNGDAVRQRLNTDEGNGISVDQVLAQSAPSATPYASLQVGLSTSSSYCDGRPCSYSRSISWKDETTPLFKDVDPIAVWRKLTGLIDGRPPSFPREGAATKSVLDAVLESANGLDKRLDSFDRQRLDRFLTKVREIEKRIPGLPSGCEAPSEPTMSAAPDAYQNNTATYNRQTHADLMNELIAFAFECDLTRVISYMLDDSRSEFVMSHVQRREFTAQGSTPVPGETCGSWHSAFMGDQQVFASINYWNTQVVASLCEKLAAIPEGDGSVLDNTVVYYGSEMHGPNHQVADIPCVLIGGGSMLRTNQHLLYSSYPDDRPLRDVYLTLLNGAFGLELESFGESAKGAPNAVIPELLL